MLVFHVSPLFHCDGDIFQEGRGSCVFCNRWNIIFINDGFHGRKEFLLQSYMQAGKSEMSGRQWTERSI
jgi:hypothetical protein